jgi:hypothetical protein
MPNDNPTAPPPSSGVRLPVLAPIELLAGNLRELLYEFVIATKQKDVSAMRHLAEEFGRAAARLDAITTAKERQWAKRTKTQTQATKGNA